MARLDFYRERFGVRTEAQAFDYFVARLQNWYDARFYVDWQKVLANRERFAAELALLSTLCRKPDRLQAATDLLHRFPQVIPALPTLLACREEVTLVEDLAESRVETYTFTPNDGTGKTANVDKYARFLVASGLLDLLDHIHSVEDYALGVEVGMDTNARKNRGGDCGIRAIDPRVRAALTKLPDVQSGREVSSDRLREMGCPLGPEFSGLVWDYAFWTRARTPKRFVVMEVNHYGSTGSKPPAIAREYSGRQLALRDAGVGFVWVTDGLGWRAMRNPLWEAFQAQDWMMTVQLASGGMLEMALQKTLMT